MYYPAPNLVVEVLSKSTESRDRGVKFSSYKEDGVKEYWLLDTLSAEVLSGLSVTVRAFFELEARQKALQAMQ